MQNNRRSQIVRYAQSQIIWKTNNLKVFNGSKKIKEPKQDTQSRLRSSMPEGGGHRREENLSFNKITWFGTVHFDKIISNKRHPNI